MPQMGWGVFARAFHAKEEICVDDQCLTKEDVRALIVLARAQTASAAGTTDLAVEPPSSTTTTASGAPIIAVQGNNPANINVGDTYGDLGAIITGPTQEDTNLGIHAEACSSQPVACSQFDSPELVTLDTSTPNEFTITYSATNQAGETGYAERVVNVLAPLSAVVDSTATPIPSSDPGTTAGADYGAGGGATGQASTSETGGDTDSTSSPQAATDTTATSTTP
ncbi:MAG: hypothetical protein Q8Q13_01925 [bacterium]|nr:hypothetical protein [bacterium]